ncbi:MAG: hypothetical protein JO021_25325, partial [Alphaproteobacteria bacterium]|nr:hypothetical protein [Alphaproteobacteria bacterium]
MALWQLIQVAQRPDKALANQQAALEHCRLFSHPATEAQRASILVLRAPGDLQTNIPLDLVLDRRHYTLHDLYFVDGHIPPALDALPPYDLVFNAISESARALSALDAAERFIAAQTKPALNAPALVRRLSRDNAPLVFADIAGCRFPRTLKLTRAALLAASPAAVLREHGLDLPVVIRPLDSHAGVDFERIETADALAAYLARVERPEIFVQPFVE